MITTNSFKNSVTPSPIIEGLVKEYLEGKVKKNISSISNTNGGTCTNIEFQI